MNIRLIIKRVLANILYCSGGLNVSARRKLKNTGFVLMYHRVIDDVGDPPFPIQPGMYVRKKSFRKQMFFLKRHFHIVSLQEMVHKMESGAQMTNCCSITFDDGWKDNFDVAFPVLKRYGIPATIFLTTGFIGTERWFWPEEVSCRIFFLSQKRRLTELQDQIGIILPKTEHIDLITDSVIKRLKQCHPAEREDIVDRIKSLCPEKFRERHMMNWSEAREMLNSGLVSFGSHTAEHRLLSQLEKDEIDREVANSKNTIKGNLGADATLFAYPNGDFTETTKAILKKYKFSGAVTTKKGYVCHSTPTFEIPRIAVHDDVSHTTPLFYSRILLNAF